MASTSLSSSTRSAAKIRRPGAGYALLLVLTALCLMAGPVAAQDDTSAPPAQTSAERPLLFVRASWVEPAVVAPGQVCRLYLELHNIGEASAEGILVTLSGQQFVPELTSSVKAIGSLQPDEHGTVWQELRAVPGLETGAYPIAVQMTYSDSYGTGYTSTETVGINVAAPAATPTPRPVVAGTPQIVVDSFSTEPALPMPGSPFTLTVLLHNSGTGAARNVSLTHGSPSVFAATGAGNMMAVGAIGWQETVAVVMPMAVDQAAKAGVNVHPITLDFDNVAGSHSQSAQTLALQVGQGSDAGVAEALVVVESYTTDPAVLTAGQSFTLTLNVRNVSAADARRLTLTLGAPSADASRNAPIAPLGSGYLRYLPEVKAGEAAQIVGQFIIAGNADAGVYVLTVGMDFAGAGDKVVTRTEQISLVVNVFPQLIFNFYREAAPYMVGQPLDLPIEILNAGRVRVASNIVEVLCDGLEIASFPGYIGPLDAGTSSTLDVTAMAEAPGPKQLTVRVHYIDAFNQPRVTDGVLTVNVEAVPEAGNPGDPNNPGNGMLVVESAEPQRPWFIRLLRGLFGLGSS